MPVVNVNLVLDDATYAGVKAGALELCGMVKDQGHRIKKHLPTVVDAAKEEAAKAIDIVREHKKGLLIIGCVVACSGAIAGTATYLTQKDRQKAKRQLGNSFQQYIDAAQAGTLTTEILDALMNDLDNVSKWSKDDTIPLDLSAKQLSALFFSIYDYTKRMAEANSIDIGSIKAPEHFKKNTIVDLQGYLRIQKGILSGAA